MSKIIIQYSTKGMIIKLCSAFSFAMDHTINRIKHQVRVHGLQNAQKEAIAMSAPTGNASSSTQTHLEADSGMVMYKSVATDDVLSIPGIAEYQSVVCKRAYRGGEEGSNSFIYKYLIPTHVSLGS